MPVLLATSYLIHVFLTGLNRGFKYRAPRAVTAIRKFAQEKMGTKDVRIHQDLNKHVWHKGIRCVLLARDRKAEAGKTGREGGGRERERKAKETGRDGKGGKGRWRSTTALERI